MGKKQEYNTNKIGLRDIDRHRHKIGLKQSLMYKQFLGKNVIPRNKRCDFSW